MCDTNPSDDLSDHSAPVSSVIQRAVPPVLHQLNVVLKVQFLRESREQVNTEALQLGAFRHGVRLFLNGFVRKTSLQSMSEVLRDELSLC